MSAYAMQGGHNEFLQRTWSVSPCTTCATVHYAVPSCQTEYNTHQT